MKKLNPEHIEVVKEIISQAPFMKLLGMQVRTLDYGMCYLELTMERKHLQAYGGIHGGVYASIIDTAIYWACYCHMPEDLGYLSADLTVNNLASVEKGRLFVEGRLPHPGRTLCLGEGDVKNEEGRLLAHGTPKLLVHEKLPAAEEGVQNIGFPPPPPKFLE